VLNSCSRASASAAVMEISATAAQLLIASSSSLSI
jgi:hypothetical protein